MRILLTTIAGCQPLHDRRPLEQASACGSTALALLWLLRLPQHLVARLGLRCSGSWHFLEHLQASNALALAQGSQHTPQRSTHVI